MGRYIYDRVDWPRFRWDAGALADPLAAARHRQGRLVGRMEALGFRNSREAALEALTDEVQKSGEIEGERLSRSSVRSSIARRLGIEDADPTPADRNIEGVVEMTVDATQRYSAELTDERLFGWHSALFPTGRSGMHRITVGAWRDDSRGPMQVVSGPTERERVHYIAPPARRTVVEMTAFLAWFNAPDAYDPVLKAALAHLWFVTIHPFDDGNGRIARIIAEMALARAERSAQRYYSMSAQIRKERSGYYDILEATQKGDLDVTQWMLWFVGCLDGAIQEAEHVLEAVLEKARFWDTLSGDQVNARQRIILNKLLEGFEGKLTTAKWAKIAKCSHDTALRDIQDLIRKGVLAQTKASGRSTGYSLRRD